MLALYRAMLRIRRSDPDLGNGRLRWLAAADGVLAFSRGEGFQCITNLSGAPIGLPADCSLLLASAELTNGLLPPDASAWLRPDRSQYADRTLRCPTDGGELRME